MPAEICCATRNPGASPPGRPGPKPPGEPNYWLRRVVVLALALGFLALLGWGGVAAVGLVRDSLAERADATAATAQPSGPSTAQPVACRPDALSFRLSEDASRAGAPVDFALTVANTSEEACLLDAGATSLVLTVTSGEDVIWSTAHCGPADPAPLLLGPEDQTERAVRWSGSRSAAGCAAVTSRVQPGTYQVTTSYASAQLPAATETFDLR